MEFPDLVEPETMQELLIAHSKEKKVSTDGPEAWTIRYSTLGGRGMFATRDIEANELVFVDAPLLIGPKCVGKHLQMCACCYKNECPLFPCDHGCGLPVCSTVCENSSKHVDYECKYLRSLEPTCGTDWSLDLLLTLVPVRGLFLTEQQRRCLASFQCHDVDTTFHEIDMLQRNLTNSPSEEDLQLMKRVCGVFNTNSFETINVPDKEHSSSLRALYPVGALQNHCCVPNTRHHFDGEHRLYVSAAIPISTGEELTMSYTSLFWDTTLRREFLSTTKHFSCMCKRCSDATELGSKLGALLCISDNCSGNLLPWNPLDMETSWTCDKCTVTVDSVQIRSIRSGLSAAVEEIRYESPRQMYNFIQKELSLLIPANNYLLVGMKFRIVSYYGRTNGLAWADLTDIELCVKWRYCNDLLDILDTLKCGDCKKRGLILYELYCTNIEKMKRAKQQLNIKNESSHFSTHADENERLLEMAVAILQNDVVAAVTLECDKQFLKQC